MVGQPVQHGQLVTWVTGASQGGRRWNWEKASVNESKAKGGLIRALRGLYLNLISGNLLVWDYSVLAFKATNR